MIRVEKLTKKFKNQMVLDGVDLQVKKGELMVIVGRSGMGKSVLLKHLIGLLTPDSGDIFIEDTRITGKGGKLKEVLYRFGMLFQGSALFDSMSMYDNVAFPLREKTKLSEAEIRDQTEYYLEAVGLKGMGHKFPSEVSGGMMKRAALARALIRKPEIVLFDEPTTGLDPIMERSVHKLIRDTHDRFGFTSVVVSHSLPTVFEIAEDVAMLHEGKIILNLPQEEFVKTDNPVVQQFMKGSLEGPIQL